MKPPEPVTLSSAAAEAATSFDKVAREEEEISAGIREL